jgi:CBS domain-containing protein
MTTDLFTVYEDELVELVAVVMDWRRIRHVMVEDRKGNLVGLVTHRGLLRYLSDAGRSSSDECVPVRDIMVNNPITVTSDMRTMDAIHLMREKKVSALPVLQDGHLVGIITEADFYAIAGDLLDDSMVPSPR